MKLWIARDIDGYLNLYINKPSLDSNDNMYYVVEDDYLNIDKDLFPEVTFENSPQQVELKLITDKTGVCFEPIKPKYPTSYAECCRVLGISDGEFMFTGLSDDEYDLCDSFVIIKRCRDAYWKIAGEEMGLGKPWKPDWKNTKKVKYSIKLHEDIITKMYLRNENVILAFPTEEMRDMFYENFKDLIEQCKELL